MDAYKRYVISTVLYGLCGVLGIIAAIVFFFQKRYFLSILSVLFAYVAIENFFCGRRARACGIYVKGHYIMPFFKKEISK